MGCEVVISGTFAWHLRRYTGAWRTEKEQIEAMMRATRAVLEQRDFASTARIIFDEARSMTGARSGYVALLSSDGSENELLFLEAGGMPCAVNPELPMPIRGLRSEAYATGKTLMDNDFMASDWARFLPSGHVELRNVMFAPLIVEGYVSGLIGLANKDGDFSERDHELATVFGEFAAIALRNSQNFEHLQETIANLEDALAEVRTLEGIITIYAWCRRIRDDDGYWQKVEDYLASRSEARFTHAICQSCAEAMRRQRTAQSLESKHR
jgi:transcriptional regulator with GAF, ATPase, and Fis domain